MTDLSTIHPLFVLALRIALASLAVPLATIFAHVALGKQRMASLREERPFAEALLLALGVLPFGLLLGFDALDPRLVGPNLAISFPARLVAALLLGLVATLPLVGALRSNSREPLSAPLSRMTLATLLLVSLLPLAALLGVRSWSALEATPFAAETLLRAPWRAALVPTDATARLSLGFRFASADDLDRARREVGYARAFGADPSHVFELESELAARMGDCASAERLFRLSIERSLDRRAASGGPLELRLGGYFLPPSLVTRCRFGARDRMAP